MSVNKYINGELITLANGSRTWIGDKASYEAAKQAGTLPTDCLIAITDDENEQAISGTNLLDNPWFTVNQRGFSGNSNRNLYGFDRWKNLVRSQDGTVTPLLNNGFKFEAVSAFTYSLCFQVLDEKDTSRLLGKKVTISYMIGAVTGDNKRIRFAVSDGTSEPSQQEQWLHRGGWIATNGNEIISETITLPSSISSSNICIHVYVECASIEILAVKLELGTASTLENDTAPNYATELLKCQRYFIRFKNDSNYNRAINLGYAHTATQLYFDLTLPSQMRTTPTLSAPSIKVEKAGSSAASGTPSASLNAIMNNIARLSVTGCSGLTTGSLYLLIINSNSYIDFSADL